MKIPARDLFVWISCVKNTFARHCVFFCVFQTFKWRWITDNQIFRWNPKATSLALLARVCILRFSSPCVEGFFICRAIFKSHVKPLLKVRAFIQRRKDMKIKTDQSLNASPATYVGVAFRNRKPIPPSPSPTHTYTLQLNAGAINYLFFITWTSRFFQQRFALNAGKNMHSSWKVRHQWELLQRNLEKNYFQGNYFKSQS